MSKLITLITFSTYLSLCSKDCEVLIEAVAPTARDRGDFKVNVLPFNYRVDVDSHDSFPSRDGSKIVGVFYSLDEVQIYCWMQGHRR